MEQTIKGLIIDGRWIDCLLSGQKTWEMRSKNTKYRGWVGLIRKGSGCVYGIARLSDVGVPLSLDKMIDTFDKHRISEEEIRSEDFKKWTTPWKLTDIQKLREPVSYDHPNGAVVWVLLTCEVRKAIFAQINDS